MLLVGFHLRFLLLAFRWMRRVPERERELPESGRPPLSPPVAGFPAKPAPPISTRVTPTCMTQQGPTARSVDVNLDVNVR